MGVVGHDGSDSRNVTAKSCSCWDEGEEKVMLRGLKPGSGGEWKEGRRDMRYTAVLGEGLDSFWASSG